MICRVNRQIVLTRTTSKTSKSRDSKSELAEEDIEKIQEAFKLFDFDGKGKIDPQFVHEIKDKMNYEEKNPRCI